MLVLHYSHEVGLLGRSGTKAFACQAVSMAMQGGTGGLRFVQGQDPAKRLVNQLVENYRKVLAQGREDRYHEEDVKIKFIIPLLEALGWDVRGLDEVKAL